MPSISVNYPSSNRFGDIRLDGLPLRKFTVNDHGVVTEMAGLWLERLLQTQGWYRDPASRRHRYAVQVDGVQSTFVMPDFDPASLEKRAWIAVIGEPGSKPEASLVVVQADGALTQKIEGVHRIRVSEQQ